MIVTLKDGRWQNNILSFTFEDPSLKLPVMVKAYLEGKKLMGESKVQMTDSKKYMIPYGG